MFGSLIGALIMTMVANGCTKMDFPNWVQEIVTGAIIIAAVVLDQLRHRGTTLILISKSQIFARRDACRYFVESVHPSAAQ